MHTKKNLKCQKPKFAERRWKNNVIVTFFFISFSCFLTEYMKQIEAQHNAKPNIAKIFDKIDITRDFLENRSCYEPRAARHLRFFITLF